MAILESRTHTGISWFGESLALLKQAPQKAFLLALAYVGIFIFLPVLLPVTGLMTALSWPIFSVIAIRMYRNIELGKAERISTVLQLIQPRIRLLLLLGLLSLLYTILVQFLLLEDFQVIAEMQNQKEMMNQQQLETAFQQMMPILLKVMLLLIPLMVAFCFAPMLVAFNQYNVIKAIKSSIAGCIQYFVALLAGWLLVSGSVILFLIFARLFIGFFAAMIPAAKPSLMNIILFATVLFATAISFAYQYVSYRDIYRAA